MGNYNKAIAGLVTPVVTYFAVKFGFDLTVDQTALIVGAVTSLVVWAVPNLIKS